MKNIIISIIFCLIFIIDHEILEYTYKQQPFNFISKQSFIISGKQHIINKWSNFLYTTNTDYNHTRLSAAKIKRIEKFYQKDFFVANIFTSPIRDGHKTSSFGYRRNPFDRTNIVYHYGIDVGCKMFTKIHAASDGVIDAVGYQQEYGKYIIIKHQHGYSSLYGHLSRLYVKKNDKINMNDCIGLSGNTGLSTGPHLHFEIRHNNKPKHPYGFIRI